MPGPVLVVGLGTFGRRFAARLTERGVDVMAIDRRRDLVEAVREDVAHAIALDSTDEEALAANIPEGTRAAMVAIGDDFEAIVLTTVLLKQLKVPLVIARAPTTLAARILRRVGADETLNPEEESADRWANRIAAPKFLNQIEFHEGYSLVEAGVPEDWVGKNLIELRLREKFSVHVVAIRRPRPESDLPPRIEMPRPDQPLQEKDVLILMGKDDDLGKIPGL